MRKLYLLLGAAAVMASASAASVNGRIDLKENITNLKENTNEEPKAIKAEVLSTSDVAVRPLQSPKKASVDKKSVLLYEDFNNVPDGNTETIGHLGERYTDYIASHYYEPGQFIDNDYTPESGTWEGDFAFAGKGGTVVLQAYDPQITAYIATPLADYSGDLTVTVRCRWAKTFWGAYNDLGYTSTLGTDLTMVVCTKGYGNYQRAVTDTYGSQLSSGQIYEQEGWQEITFKIRNESANADGYIMFGTGCALEIDWIKITDDNTFLAAPVTNDATNFTNDGFTINWDPVRRSSNYYIDLWKTVYTADSGINEIWKFEDEEMPDWLLGPDVDYAEGQGVDGTNAVMLTYDGINGGITTDDMGMKLHSFSTKVMFQADIENMDWENPLTLCLDVYGENGWEPFGSMMCDGWNTYPGYYYDLVIDDDYFNGLYTAVRIYAQGTNEDNVIFIDDFSVFAERPFVLERVMGENSAMYDPENDDFSYNYYYYTGLTNDTKDSDTSYTFTDLEPESEYWYRVRSHNVSTFAMSEKIHAFGVAAPELLPASNISETSFTANWIDAPKAQKYTVTNYTGVEATDDDPQFTFLEETFSRCSGEAYFEYAEPIGNEAECVLDDYTDLKGWRGKGNTVGENFIGTVNGGYVITPPIMANPNRGSLYVYLDVTGNYGDYLSINTLLGGLSTYAQFDEDGQVIGWLELPAIEGEQIKIRSYYGNGLSLNGFEAMQEVKAGDIVRRFDSSVEVPAGEQAYTFNNLKGGIYAYNVVSSFTLERQTTKSVSDKFVTVNTENGNSNVTNKIDIINNGVVELERYSIDGIKVDKDYRGVVILKMNDGSVTKKMIK